MNINERIQECQEAVKLLLDKKIENIKFKPYENNCWRLYIVTDKGKLVLTFCKDWDCPVIEKRDF